MTDGLDNDCDGSIDEDAWTNNDDETNGFDDLPADEVWETEQEVAGGCASVIPMQPKMAWIWPLAMLFFWRRRDA